MTTSGAGVSRWLRYWWDRVTLAERWQYQRPDGSWSSDKFTFGQAKGIATTGWEIQPCGVRFHEHATHIRYVPAPRFRRYRVEEVGRPAMTKAEVLRPTPNDSEAHEEA